MTNHQSAPDLPPSVAVRIRRLRLALGLTQIDLAARSGIAPGALSMIENGHQAADPQTLRSLSEVLDCQITYFSDGAGDVEHDEVKLRRYADAPQRSVDRAVFDSVTAVQTIRSLALRTPDARLRVHDGDLDDDDRIDRIAGDVRSAAGLEPDTVIPNVMRAAERLGCILLPIDGELGRHPGLSLTVDGLPVIRVTRPSHDRSVCVPAERQRQTVAHEIGHLVLHSRSKQPANPMDAARMESEANRFAAAFLVPGEAVLTDVGALGSQLTATNLAALQQKWGYPIKAFALRLRELGVVDDAALRALSKEISTRVHEKRVSQGTQHESGAWFGEALRRSFPGDAGLQHAAKASGLGERYLRRWLAWQPYGSPVPQARITRLHPRSPTSLGRDQSARVVRLPRRS